MVFVVPDPSCLCISFDLKGRDLHAGPGEVTLHRQGLEFFCDHACDLFSVLEITLAQAGLPRPLTCSGVVVACEPCSGRHRVTVLFLGLPESPSQG
jgi:hypothetical protein